MLRRVKLPAFCISAAALLTFALVPSAQQPPQPDADFLDALWVAGSGDLLKLELGGGTLLTSTPAGQDALAAAVDPESFRVWIFDGGENLNALDFAGNLLLSVPFGGELGEGAVHLAAGGGFVWLGFEQVVYQIDAAGEIAGSFPVTSGLRGLAYDASRPAVWLANLRQVSGYDPSGQLLAELDLGRQAHVVDLASDADGGLWVAQNGSVTRFDGELEPVFDSPLDKVRAVAADGGGGAWVALQRDVVRLGGDGGVLSQTGLTPGGGSKNLLDIVADPRQAGAWALSTDFLFRFDDAGQLAAALDLGDLGGGTEGRALATYADLVAPELAFTAPADGALLNDARPTLELAYSDAAIGVDTTSFEATTHDAPLALTCSFDLTSATCTPDSALPEGAVTLEATVADFLGNRSEPAVLHLTIDTVAPAAPDAGLITAELLPSGEALVRGAAGGVEAEATVTVTNLRSGEAVDVAAGGDGSFTAALSAQAGDVLEITATDAAGNTSPATAVNVAGALDLLPVPDQSVVVGAGVNLQLVAAGGSGPLSFSVAPLPLPEGAQLNAVSGTFTFRPSLDQVGSYAFTFSVTDGVTTDSESATLTVSAPTPGTPTSVAGRVLDTTDAVAGVETPIVGVRVSLLGSAVSALTDADGRFELPGVPGGEQVMDFDSSAALPAPDGSPYASFREMIVLTEGTANVFERPFFLPRIDPASLTTVDPAATTVVANPNLGVSLTVPPATAKNSDGSNFTGQLSLSEVPGAVAPVALPEFLEPGMLLTLQPVGVTFANPVPLTMANVDGLSPGSETDLWSVNPATGEFEIVGVGRVSADGSVIETISGGIRAASWHALLPPGSNPDGSDNNGDNQDPDKCDDCDAGSQTALASGNLSVAHDLLPYFSHNRPRALRLVYNSQQADPRPVVQSRTTIPVRAAVPQTLSASIGVGGVDLGDEVFSSTAGLSENRDETVRQVLQVDATDLPTGAYPYRMRLTSNYGSTRISSFSGGQLLVNNLRQSPLGAGWAIAGLQRIHPQADRSLVIADGDGTIQRFQAATTAENGLLMRMFDTPNPVGAVGNGFAGLTPGTFRVTTAAGSELVDARVVPVVDFPDTGFDFAAFYNVGPNGFLDGGSQPSAPRGDDISFQPPGGNDTFGAQLTGFLFLPLGGDVVFTVGVDDAFDLIVNGQSVVRFLGGTDFRNFTGTASGLPAGFVPITLNYGEIFGEADLVLRATGGGLPGGVIPAQFLFVEVPTVGSDPTEFLSPPGDFSTLARNPDGSYTRTFKDGSQLLYDAAGLQVASIDSNGNTTTYDYDGQGRLLRRTDAAGLVTTLTYAGGQLSAIADPAGQTTQFQHDAAGNLVSITDPDGSVRRFTYDTSHRLVAQIGKRGFTTSYTYNFAGRNTDVLRPDGSLRQIFAKQTVGLFDSASGIGTEANPAPVVRPEQAVAGYTDGNGTSVAFDTDRFGGSVLTVDAFGEVTSASRDDNGNPLVIDNSNGLRQSFGYDSQGNVTAISWSDPTTGEAKSVGLVYDPANATVEQITDAAGNTVSIDYDAAGNPVRITNALGDVRTATYDSRGLLTSRTDENGHTTTYAYDARGNTETITDALGTVTRFRRDAAGRVTAITEAEGLPEERTTTFGYDAAGQVTAITGPSGAVTRFTYDASGNTVEMISPTGEVTRRAFDTLNRLVRLEDPADGTTTFAYDGNGNLVEVVDGRGGRTVMQYDANNRLIKSVDPAGGEQLFAYDGRGNLIRFTNAAGAVWRSTYDIFDRRRSVTDPLGNTTTFTYDARNFLATATDARGQTYTYGYDALGRLTTLAVPGNVIRRTYDAVGNVVSIEDDDSHLTLAYDELNRAVTLGVVDVGVQPAVTLTQQLDALGRRVRRTDSLGGVTRYAYDARGRATGITTPAGETLGFTHDPAGRFAQIDLPNGISSRFGYDTGGRIASLEYFDGGGTNLLSFGYLYDTVGNLIQIAEGSKVRSFAYDSLERLVSGGTAGLPETYDYDAVGNRVSSFLSATYRYDAANRLLQDDQHLYAYDSNGNLTSKTDQVTGEVTTYAYDGLDQLAGVTLPDGTVVSYRYDGIGRRIEKNVGGVVTRYIYDGRDIYLELDGSNSVTARYTHGPGADQPLVVERGGVSYYYLADHQGSIRFLTDAAGNAVNSYEYDSFGRTLVESETVANPYRYTGRELDEETGLYYYRARYYDPEVGRFVSQDPLRFMSGASNFYGYLENNPVAARDPAGTFSFWDALDVLSFLWSAKEFIDCPTLGNFGNLALDTLGLLPIIPGVGTVRRAIDIADSASDAARLGDRARDAVNAADNVHDALNAADNATDLSRRAKEILGESDDIVVIGRARNPADTAVAKEWPGHHVLDVDDWSIDLNDAWVAEAIDQGRTVYTASPSTADNLWDAANNRSTVFGRELQQFLDAGYTWQGDYLIPPGR